MLYDPKWEVETKPVPSVRGLIAWLETKNPRGMYDYWNCGGRCLLGQYFNAIGLKWNDAGGPGFEFFTKSDSEEADRLQNISSCDPYTFGAALERARKVATR